MEGKAMTTDMYLMAYIAYKGIMPDEMVYEQKTQRVYGVYNDAILFNAFKNEYKVSEVSKVFGFLSPIRALIIQKRDQNA